jgi:serine/threonine-protein kinase
LLDPHLKTALSNKGIIVYQKLGRGAQRTAWKASFHNHLVVVKIKEAPASFRDAREHKHLSTKLHPRIPQLLLSLELKSGLVAYYVTVEELIRGTPAISLLQQQLALPSIHVHRFLTSGLEVLSVLESRGIVHRDIKPENIIISDDTELCLVDFGIMKHCDDITHTIGATGPHSALYAPPEFHFYKQQVADHMYDLFSLGVSVLSLAFGNHPYFVYANPYSSVHEAVELIKTHGIPRCSEIGLKLPQNTMNVIDTLTASRTRRAKSASGLLASLGDQSEFI